MNIPKKRLTSATFLLSTLALAACTPVETKTSLLTPVSVQIRSAGPGDFVMNFQSRRSLPNIVGKADLFGRTTDAGHTTVRYLGTRRGQAVFERSDVSVESNATTMSETPLILRNTTNTNVNGTIGGTPVSATAASTSFQYIPPRGSSQYATAAQPIQIALGKGSKRQGRRQNAESYARVAEFG
ncbi:MULTISPECIES: hypothetical protein [unclassified Mesorhizobium]|uniref:hypothetical protein n=1 Tax=unclassified Mesorhizobium TaxID=325217 RepID=UPI00333ADF6D